MNQQRKLSFLGISVEVHFHRTSRWKHLLSEMTFSSNLSMKTHYIECSIFIEPLDENAFSANLKVQDTGMTFFIEPLDQNGPRCWNDIFIIFIEPLDENAQDTDMTFSSNLSMKTHF